MHVTLKQQSGSRYPDHYLKEKKIAFPRRIRSDLPKVTKPASQRSGSRIGICLLDADCVFLPFCITLDCLLFYSDNSQTLGGPGMIFGSI